MYLSAEQLQNWRRTSLFAPILAMTLGGLALVVVLSVFLIGRFDAASAMHERAIVQRGLLEQARELDAVVATQVDWDDAIERLDTKFDPDWADVNLGKHLYTFKHFSHVFVIDGDAQVFYAAVKGERSGLASYAPFKPVADRLVTKIRLGEVSRGAIKLRPGKDNIVIPPIQANAVTKINGTVYVVTATLVQPDFGKKLPKGPRAPITIAVLPINAATLAPFAERYLLNDVRLITLDTLLESHETLVLRDPDKVPIAGIAWIPARPGALLRQQLQVPLLLGVSLLGLLALCAVQRGATIVRDLIASEARARHLAYHDLLTQLPNRALLFDRLRGMLAARRPGLKQLAVICVDLDRFKEVNDALGHHAGDLLIQAVAARLRETCNAAALIARLGGDEFVILQEIDTPATINALAQAVLSAIGQPVQTEYGLLEVGCSLGVALIDHAGVEPSEALRWADVALYRSKEAGRSCVTFFEPEMDEALRTRLSLEADLRQALTDGSLHMVYQPQVDRAGGITAVEALLRWDHPLRGAIPPGMFVPLAEETGIILALGEFVLRRVFEETAQWKPTRVAINVSAVQLRSPGFAAVVTRLAASAGIEPSRYEIELTETALLGDDPAIAGNVEALKRLGFSLALGDFGTGYSSLSVLQRFSVDRIKIDRSFVSALGDSGASEALVDSMIKLARAMSLTVIAEGVETDAQMAILVACGCREFQGHLTGMPQPAAVTAGLLGVTSEPASRIKRLG